MLVSSQRYVLMNSVVPLLLSSLVWLVHRTPSTLPLVLVPDFAVAATAAAAAGVAAWGSPFYVFTLSRPFLMFSFFGVGLH